MLPHPGRPLYSPAWSNAQLSAPSLPSGMCLGLYMLDSVHCQGGAAYDESPRAATPRPAFVQPSME